MARKILFVFGMARSGTSAMTRVLSLCGLQLPEKLLGAFESNQRGHWEPVDALNLNEAFLHRRGSSYFDPTLRIHDAPDLDLPDAAAFMRDICAFLSNCPQEGDLLLKEPRMVGLFPYWERAALQSGFDIKIVIPLRAPDQVIGSLMHHYGLTQSLSALLWIKYNLLAERYSRPYSRVFVNHADILQDWRIEVARIATTLGLEFPHIDEDGVGDFLAPDLTKQRALPSKHNVLAAKMLHDVHACLSHDDLARAPAWIKLDTLFEFYRSTISFFHEAQKNAEDFLAQLSLRFGRSPSGQMRSWRGASFDDQAYWDLAHKFEALSNETAFEWRAPCVEARPLSPQGGERLDQPNLVELPAALESHSALVLLQLQAEAETQVLTSYGSSDGVLHNNWRRLRSGYNDLYLEIDANPVGLHLWVVQENADIAVRLRSAIVRLNDC